MSGIRDFIRTASLLSLSSLIIGSLDLVRGADLYWSGDGVSQGGNGTWDTSTARWGTSAGGPYSTTWNNSNNDDAIFGSTAGNVTLGANIQIGQLIFNTSGYEIGGSYILDLATGSPFTNNIGTVTFTNGLVVTNMGALKIGYQDSDNDLIITGATVYATGLQVGYCKSGSASRNVVTVNSGTLDISGAINIPLSGFPPGSPNSLNSLVLTNGASVTAAGLLRIADNYTASGVSNSVKILNGSTLTTAGASSGYNTSSSGNFIEIIGASGVTSTWDVGAAAITLDAQAPQFSIKVDGAGESSSAVVTNTGDIVLDGSSQSIVVTNGGRLYSGGEVQLGGSSSRATVVGGATASLWDLGNDSLFAGYRDDDFVFTLSPGCTITNAATLNVGWGNASDNLMVVTGAGARASSSGNIFVGRIKPSFPANQPADDNTLLLTSGSTTEGTGFYVGSGGYGNGGSARNNAVTITNGAQLQTSGTSYIGIDNPTYWGNFNGNSITVAGRLNGTNSTWDMGGADLYIGFKQRAASTVTNNSLSVDEYGIATNIDSLVISASNSLGLATGGRIYTTSVTSSGSFEVTLRGGIALNSAYLNVSGNLNITGTSLDFLSTRSGGTYILSEYGSLTGQFSVTNGLPAGSRIFYDYKGANQIAVRIGAEGTLFLFR